MIDLRVTIPEGNGYSADTLGRVNEHIRQVTRDRAWFSMHEGVALSRRDGSFIVRCASSYESIIVKGILVSHYGLEAEEADR